LANTYAPLASPSFTTCTCAPIVCATTCFVGSGAGLTGTAGSLKANNSSCLNGVLPAGYLLSGGTAVCATCAIGAKNLCGCVPSCFLGATVCATDSNKLNNVTAAGYLLSGGTAKNSLCLGGALANTYAPLASPAFTTCITTPLLKLTSVVGKTTETVVAYIKSDGTILSGTSAGGGVSGTGTANYLPKFCAASTLVNSSIYDCGNVGIGTTAPTNKLHLAAGWYGSVQDLSSVITNTSLRIADAGLSTQGGLYFGIGSAWNPVIQAALNASSVLDLYIQPFGGNVGIGNVAPASLLHLSTSRTDGNRITPVDILTLESKSPDFPYSGFGGKLLFKSQVYASGILNTGFLGVVMGATYDTESDMIFGLRTSSSVSERMRLTGIGNLTICGCGTGVDWIASSDCRLKTCIKPIMGALSTVMQLQGVCYELCDDEKHENQLGLIAQDVEKILPAIVSHSKPNEEDFKYNICDNKLGLKYEKLSAVLIEAIKEQQKQIEENKKQISCLCLELNYMRNYNK
jgi:hypothetical protein